MEAAVKPMSVRRVLAAVLLSLLLAVYSPMALTTSAQSAQDSRQLQQLKQKITKELDRRTAELQATLRKLNSDVRIDNIGLDASLNSLNGRNLSVEVSPDTKKKAKELAQKYITQLGELKQKVNDTDTLEEAQEIAKAVDSQSKLTQTVSVQASMTKAVESLTGAFDRMRSSANQLQGQVTKVKSCADGNSGASYCSAANGADAKESAANAQAQLDNAKTIMTTIGSMLASLVAIVLALVMAVVGVTTSLAGGSLGDASGTQGLGSLTGILSSFTALGSQLDLTGGLTSNASGLLGGVTGIMSMFNL